MTIRRLSHLAYLSVSLVLCGCNVFYGPHYAEGEIAKERVAVELDSDIAKIALNPASVESEEVRRKYQALTRSIPDELNSIAMQKLIEEGSADFASIVFARDLLEQGSNRCWQNQSWQLSQNLDQPQIKQRMRSLFESHHLLVVPGWHWQSRPQTGAAMGYPRKILQSLGLQNELIETDEHGSVAINAGIIAKAVTQSKEFGKPVILISASKGGADAAYAIGKNIDLKEVPYLKGWLNVGGVIAGSTLVDYALHDPAHWLQWLGLPEDTPIDGMQDLATKASVERLQMLNFTQELQIVNYTALAFASSVSERSRNSYQYLARIAPNDAAALVNEMRVPGKPTVLEYGLDHYMRDQRAMQRIIALLMLMMEEPAACD